MEKLHGDFKADIVQAIKMAVWVRFPLLPAEYYDEEMLEAIAKKLGKPLKFDNKWWNLLEGVMHVCVLKWI